MTYLLLVAGIVVLVVVTLDQMATILATGRTSGSIIPRLTSAVWRAVLASHRRWPSHRRLSVVGVAMLVAAPALWASGLWLGWTLIAVSDAEAVVESETGASASLAARAYFAGFNLFTLGLGDVRPGSDGWRLVAVVASFMGLAMITLGVSYLVPVVSAATERRHLARLLRQLGRSPEEMLAQEDLLVEELMSARSTIALVTEQHLTHPVLRYYHAVEESLSLPVRTVAVWEPSRPSTTVDAPRVSTPIPGSTSSSCPWPSWVRRWPSTKTSRPRRCGPSCWRRTGTAPRPEAGGRASRRGMVGTPSWHRPGPCPRPTPRAGRPPCGRRAPWTGTGRRRPGPRRG